MKQDAPKVISRRFSHNEKGDPVHLGFAQIRIKKNGKKLRFMEITSEAGGIVRGWRVMKNGERWYKETAKHYTTELIVASESDIVQRMALNLKYELLEAIGD
jgi:hypothetical protein